MTIPPHYLRRGQVAVVLGLPAYRVDYITRRGDLPLQNEHHRDRQGWKEYALADVDAYAKSRGIVPRWELLSE